MRDKLALLKCKHTHARQATASHERAQARTRRHSKRTHKAAHPRPLLSFFLQAQPGASAAEPRLSSRQGVYLGLPARQPGVNPWASTLTSTCADLRRPASTCVNLSVDATMCGRRQLRRPASTADRRPASTCALYGAWARVTCREGVKQRVNHEDGGPIMCVLTQILSTVVDYAHLTGCDRRPPGVDLLTSRTGRG
jgi:hypothetical protein